MLVFRNLDLYKRILCPKISVCKIVNLKTIYVKLLQYVKYLFYVCKVGILHAG